MFFFVFFCVFRWFFLGSPRAWDSYKGRISKNTLQISLEASESFPCRFSLCSPPQLALLFYFDEDLKYHNEASHLFRGSRCIMQIDRLAHMHTAYLHSIKLAGRFAKPPHQTRMQLSVSTHLPAAAEPWCLSRRSVPHRTATHQVCWPMRPLHDPYSEPMAKRTAREIMSLCGFSGSLQKSYVVTSL